MRTEAEVYRFSWDSSFHGDAVVRIGRRSDEVALRWAYRWDRLRGRSALLYRCRWRIGVGYRTR